MNAKLAKWGNSYAVRLPKHVVDNLDLKEDEELLLTTKSDSLTLRKSSKEAQLDALLATVSSQEELAWGSPRGKEVW